MSKRNSGEGVIYQEKNRGLWIYQVVIKTMPVCEKERNLRLKPSKKLWKKVENF